MDTPLIRLIPGIVDRARSLPDRREMRVDDFVIARNGEMWLVGPHDAPKQHKGFGTPNQAVLRLWELLKRKGVHMQVAAADGKQAIKGA
jgi:hypothetical protein